MYLNKYPSTLKLKLEFLIDLLVYMGIDHKKILNVTILKHD